MKMDVWHIRAMGHSRAFVNPVFVWEKVILLFRGYYPFNDYLYSKPSEALRKLILNHERG